MVTGLNLVGPRLRSARHARGWTLEDLASRAQMSASTLSRLESGKRQASLELLLPLTRQLGIRIDDLITQEAPDPRVRREVIRDVGLLDDSFFMYGEEIDWQMRMNKAGYQVWFLPSARIVHYGGGSSAQAVTRMKKMEYQSREMFVDKHYSPLARRIYKAKTALGMAFWQTLGKVRRQPVQVR